jgi:hypothetical protein
VRVRNGANTANALDDLGSIFRTAIANNELHAAEGSARHPSVGDNAIGDFHLSAKVTFDSSDRVDNGTSH